MSNQSIANGEHYKQVVIVAADVGQIMNADFLARKLKLADLQKDIVENLIDGASSVCNELMIGSRLDPFFVDIHIKYLGIRNGTIYKKTVRLGKGDKSESQDLADIVGACNRTIELLPFHEGLAYKAIIKLIEDAQ